jgi:hypothetical protein
LLFKNYTMSIHEFLSKQVSERKPVLSAIHEIIVSADKNAKAEVGTMMGKEMILYKTSGVFKYGLSSVKAYMSLHVMPIYGSVKLHSRYEKLLSKAKFQKGCINFKNAEEMPLDIVRQLMDDCAKVDLVAIMESLKKDRERKYF